MNQSSTYIWVIVLLTPSLITITLVLTLTRLFFELCANQTWAVLDLPGEPEK